MPTAMKPASQRKPTSKRALTDKQIAQAYTMTQTGLTQRQVGTIMGIDQSTLAGYFRTIKEQTATLETAKESLADTWYLNHALNQYGTHKLLTNLLSDDVFPTLSNQQKIAMLPHCNTGAGTGFDKIRLHEGKSTSNNSHQIVVEQGHKRLPFRATSSVSSVDITDDSAKAQ